LRGSFGQQSESSRQTSFFRFRSLPTGALFYKLLPHEFQLALQLVSSIRFATHNRQSRRCINAWHFEIKHSIADRSAIKPPFVTSGKRLSALFIPNILQSF